MDTSTFPAPENGGPSIARVMPDAYRDKTPLFAPNTPPVDARAGLHRLVLDSRTGLRVVPRGQSGYAFKKPILAGKAA